MADIPGLEIATAVDEDGVVWQIIGKDAPRPYHVYADAMEDLVGCLPDALSFERDAPSPPPGLRLVPQGLAEGVHGCLRARWQHVEVVLDRRGDVLMPEPFLHDGQGDVAGDQPRDMGVA